ncbi:MAG: FAD-binding oxidoreductase [Gemmatimonadales bacterium]
MFRDDAGARAVYAEAAGIQRIWPSAVAVPEDAADLRVLVRWAHATRTPLIPRASGSSMAGGAIGAGVIADVSRLRDVSAVDARRHLLVGPGVLREEADAAAGACGLRFPVDPSSGAFCTIGGMASTNAGGAHTLKYGSTRSWVTALDCIFDDGARALVSRGQPAPTTVPAIRRFLQDVAPEIHAAGAARLQHPGVRKDSSGYAVAEYARSGDLVDLLVGSEGTLAVFAGIELALIERPGATASLLAAFPTLDAAVGAARMARDAGAAACELLDRTFLDFVREAARAGETATRLPAETDAVLLIEIEAASPAAASEGATALSRGMRAHGATQVELALGTDAEAALWELRHAASPVLSRLDPALKSMQFIEDGAVPPEHLAAYVRGVRAAMQHHGIRGAIFGHAGDANIHVNPLIDIRDPAWPTKVRALLGDVVALTVRLGGTLSGEHGDGRLRAPLEPMLWPDPDAPAPRLYRAVKAAFDPHGILNPGAKVAAAGTPILGDVKYDASLPPLPTAARRALDRVDSDRLYATPRLALLGR